MKTNGCIREEGVKGEYLDLSKGSKSRSLLICRPRQILFGRKSQGQRMVL